MPVSRTPRFDEWAEDWLARTRTRVPPKTIDLYEDLVRHHLTPYFGEMRLGAISRHDVEQYRGHAATTPRAGRKTAAARKTVNHTLMVLKAIFTDAINHRHMQ